jgi:hypothetical protein
MTGVASDVHLAIGELAVDGIRHFHHVARDELLGIFIAGTILNMAEVAILSERRAHPTHGRTDVFGLQNFEILRGAASPSLFRSILGTECGRGKQQSYGKKTHDPGYSSRMRIGERDHETQVKHQCKMI